MSRTIGPVLGVLSILILASPAAAADAAATFKTKCAMCHGADGAGQTAMGKKLAIRALGSAEVQKQTDAELIAIISKGKGKMPAYGGKISDSEIAGLTAHIRTFAKK
ncbi:MAG: cytochrome c [Thermoanaerobaculia bacterium]|nr:cytochrome c [Thermoanaerobaculia bacterium]